MQAQASGHLCIVFVAWAFCQNNQKHDTQTACGHCESCQWLIANTHPNLYQLPKPLLEAEKSPKKNQILDESPTHQATTTIKIDDIRTMQPFVQQSSHGVRIVVIHQADQMTLGEQCFVKNFGRTCRQCADVFAKRYAITAIADHSFTFAVV